MRNKLGQFTNGFTPWNKNLKGFRPSKETEFKTGELIGDTHPSWKGGVQVTKKDCTYLWAGANKRVRRPRVIWESYYGPVPDKMVIIHVDGNRYNDDINNLKAITRAELLFFNSKRNKL
jgi:hypothetical protein